MLGLSNRKTQLEGRIVFLFCHGLSRPFYSVFRLLTVSSFFSSPDVASLVLGGASINARCFFQGLASTLNSARLAHGLCAYYLASHSTSKGNRFLKSSFFREGFDRFLFCHLLFSSFLIIQPYLSVFDSNNFVPASN